MDEICERIGEYVYSSHGLEMHEVCAELLSKNGLKLAVAESCTGGMIAKLNAAKIVTDVGIPMFILNGHDPEILYTLLDGGHVGTYFTAKKK